MTPNQSDRINLSLFVSPHFYLHELNGTAREATFVQMSRASYQQSAFLDDRIIRAGNDRFTVRMEELLDFFESNFGAPQKLSYIFHMAFCGSTLLSRAIDIPGNTMVYREPVALHQMAMLNRQETRGADFDNAGWERWLRMISALLTCTDTYSESAIVKATDSCNNIIPELLALHADSTGIVMYDNLEGFLVSCLKADSRRRFVRKAIHRAAADVASSESIADIDIGGLSDARAAAYVWISQMHVCKTALDNAPDRLRSVSIGDFLGSPQQTLERLAVHFDIDLAADMCNEICNGPVFARHAKTDIYPTYDQEARIREHSRLANTLREEIADGVEWARSVAGVEADAKLPGALLA